MDAETGSPEVGTTYFPVPDNEMVAETPVPGPGDNYNNFSLNFKKCIYVVFDIETTGLSRDIIE